MNKKIKQNETGLTMIELVIAIGLMSLVVTIMFNIFVLSGIAQRKINAFKSAADNARFAVELITREIRTGKNFNNDSGSLSFVNARGEAVVYRLNGKIIEKSSDGGINYSAITGPEVAVDYLNFHLLGQASGDGLQPRITVVIGATSFVGNQSANLKIQTTISGRFLQS